MQKEVRLIAPLHSNSGYGKAGRGLLAALLTQGYTVEAIEKEADTETCIRTDGSVVTTRTPMRSRPMRHSQQVELDAALATQVSHDAPTILLGTPDDLTLFPEYPNKRIGFTMWEVNEIPSRWERRLSCVDRVVVPSQWNAAQIPAHNPAVIPLCVDERCWSTEGAVYPIGEQWKPDFLFLSVFYVSERKNWQEMLGAFAEEFLGESVGLLIRASGENEYLRECVRHYQRIGVKVEVLTEELSEEELAGLYRLADCFVLPSTEGFGMPYVEAALCGTPSIGLFGQAGGETVEALGGVQVASRPAQAFSRIPHLYSPQMTHLKPHYEALRRAMRDAAENGIKGALISERVKRFSCERIGAQLAAVIEEVRAAETVIPEPKEIPLGVAIMLTRNHLDKTKIAIESLKRTAPETAILVVDDGSEDETVEWLRSEGVTVIESPTRNIATNWNTGVEWLLSQGFAYLNEIGWDGPIVFSDNDIEYQEGWFEGLWRVMESDSTIGIVAPAKWKPSSWFEGQTVLQNCGNWLSECFEGRDGKLLRAYEPDYVETACMMVRSEVWRRIRMDERFPIFYNDVDYCFEARKLGYRVVATPLANVKHTPNTTSAARGGESATLRSVFLQKRKGELRG